MKVTQQRINDAPKYFSQVILGDLYSNGVNCWIAGGSVRDYFMGRDAIDYDIFFPNEKEFNKAKSFFENNNAVKEWESENGIKYLYNDRTFDLVKIYHDTPQSTISYFDFTTAMFAVNDKSLFAGDRSFDDLEKRNLVINKVTYPDSTLKRAFRYYKKGFKMSAKESEKLAKIIKKMPFKNGNDDFLNFTSSGDTTPSPITPILKKKNYLPYILAGAGFIFILFAIKDKKQ